MDNNLTSRQKAILAYKTAKPSAKIFLLVVIAALFAIIMVVIGSLTGESTENTGGESSVEGLSGTSTITASETVINDSKSEHGKVVAEAERRRVLYEANKGNSAMQALIEDQDDKALSPYTEKAPDVSNQVRIVPPKVTVTPVATPKVTPATGGLSEQQIEDLTKPIAEIRAPRKEPGTANIYSKKELAGDPLLGMTAERYQAEMKRRVDDFQKQMNDANSKVSARQEKVATWGVIADNSSAVSQTSNASVPGASIGSAGSAGAGSAKPAALWKSPGDYIAVFSDFPVDSRTTTTFVAKGAQDPYKEARFRCTVKDTGDFLVPNCTNMVINGIAKPIEAMVINPRTWNGIIEQDVDDDLLIKSMALIGSKLIGTWGTTKLQTGQKITETTTGSNSTTTTENTLTDREIFLGAIGTSVGDMSKAAETYYSKASVKTIPAQTVFLLVFTNPVHDYWGLTEKSK